MTVPKPPPGDPAGDALEAWLATATGDVCEWACTKACLLEARFVGLHRDCSPGVTFLAREPIMPKGVEYYELCAVHKDVWVKWARKEAW